MIYHHGLTKQVCSRGQKGEAIILSPTFFKFYKKSGSKPALVPENEDSIDFGRFIGLKLQIEIKRSLKGSFQKRKEKNKSQSINLFISTTYHPTDSKDQSKFNNFISSIYDTTPKSYFLISGQDMNANIGTRENKICKSIGPFGINNRNAKGAEAVNILRIRNLHAPLTFYQHK